MQNSVVFSWCQINLYTESWSTIYIIILVIEQGIYDLPDTGDTITTYKIVNKSSVSFELDLKGSAFRLQKVCSFFSMVTQEIPL